jgi:hypothetical protein
MNCTVSPLPAVPAPYGSVTVFGTGTSASMYMLTNGVAYTFTARCCNQLLCSDASNASAAAVPVASPGLTPGAPVNAQALSVSAQELLITWAPPLPNGGLPVTGYLINVTSLDGASPLSRLFNVSSVSTSLVISNLTTLVDYRCEISAYSDAGVGLHPAAVNGKPTQRPPQSVSGVSGVNVTPTR